jgi:hypothetical protein
MTIQSTNLVMLESERMTDEPTGGGRPTGRVIPDNTLNAIFPKTSRLDRTTGVVNMTKVFCGVKIATAEAYRGSHFALTRDAEDQNINVVCCPGTPTDTRADARARIEAYYVPGVDARMFLLGDQYAGQRTVLLYQEAAAPLPELGSTIYWLQKDATGAVVQSEFLKIGSMTYANQTFTYEKNGEFLTITRRVLTIKLSTRLKNTFLGGTPYPTGTTRSDSQPAAKVYNTNIGDSAQFYGVSALKLAAVAGQTTIRVNDVYKPIVPSAYGETLISEQQALGELAQLVQSGDAQTQTLQFALVSGNQSRAYLPRVPMRGSSLVIDGGTYKDDGAGQMRLQSGTDNFSQITVSYETGQIDVWRKSSAFTGSATASFTPAARLLGPAISFSTPVTIASRTFSWVWDLAGHVPELGTLSIWYRSLGKWQLLQDDGTGKLTGSGTGTITAAGTVASTFNSLPDAETSIVVAYLPQGSLEFTKLGGQTKAVAKAQTITTGYAVAPTTLSITWISGGVTKSLTDNGSGQLTGDVVAPGSISYAGKQLSFVPTGLPDNGTYQLTYTRAAYALATVTIPDSAEQVASFNTGKELTAGKTVISYSVIRRTSTGARSSVKVTLTDDGAGKLLRAGVQVGTIDYATGSGTFSWAQDYSYTITSYSWGEIGMQANKEVIAATELSAGAGTLQGLPSNEANGTTESLTVNMPELSFIVAANLVSGSLMFTDGGNVFIDRDGVLWKNPDSRTGAGSRVGRVELEAGRVIISDAKGLTGNLTINAGAAMTSRPYIASATWRTPGSPLKTSSFTVKAVGASGNLLTASANANGDISGVLGSGTIDISTGLAHVGFSAPVDAGSLIYSTIVMTALPLNSDAIGLDPVRLPPDGKVPIFADGIGVVIGHTATLDIGTPTANQVIDCGRDYIAEVWITDSSANKLAVNQYSEDRDAGLLTMSATLNLITETGAALTPPLTLHHRIEHRSLLQDVQPNGALTLAIPLAQDYPSGDSYVSSYIHQGVRFPSWSNLFTQQTWDSNSPNWGHAPVGPEILPDYNAVDFPIEVNGEGTVDDEWLIKFSSTTTFDVISRDRGLIGSGRIDTDLTLINPNTGTPYLVMRKGGWSLGWGGGNVVRFTTTSILAPVWLVRCVSMGVATHPDDRVEYMQYGDSD